VSGLALGALAVGALAAPAVAPDPAPPTGALGGAVLNSSGLDLPARLAPPASSAGPTLATTAGGSSAEPAVVPTVLDVRLRDRLARIPAAFRPFQ
jgi:hypothetical protein